MSEYDLARLLTTPLKSRKQWADLAQAATNILYNEYAVPRTALALSNESEALSRDYKIAAVKSMGLDYRSSLLTDADYDRILLLLAKYNVEKGTNDFINFMGYFKNTRYQMIPLWTFDFVDFRPRVPFGSLTIFEDEAEGSWYPTSHVGLGVEVDIEHPDEDINEEDITELFYKLAPINLVLKWIAAAFTIVLPRLYLASGITETEYFTAIGGVDYGVNLYFKHGVFSTENFNTVYDMNKDIHVEMNPEAYCLDSSYDPLIVAGEIYWDETFKFLPEGFTFYRNSEAGVWNKDGSFTWLSSNEPRINSYDPSTGTSLGWLFEPEQHNLFKKSNNFDLTQGVWKTDNNATTAISPIKAPDSSYCWRITDNEGIAASIYQELILDLAETLWSVSFIVKGYNSGFVAIKLRLGFDYAHEATVVLDLTTGDTVGTANFAEFGSKDLGNGFYMIYGVFDRMNHSNARIDFYPAWGQLDILPDGDIHGSVDLWIGQINEGSKPSSPIRSGITRGYRGADLLDILKPSRFSLDKGTVIYEYSPIAKTNTTHTLLDCQNGYGDYLSLKLLEGITTQSHIKKGGVELVQNGLSENLAEGSRYKFSYVWENLSGTKALYENGNTGNSQKFFYWVNNFKHIRIGGNVFDSGENMFGYLSLFVQLPIALSEAEMHTITDI